MEPRTDLRPGERVGVQVDAGRVHVFDPETGENWVRRPAARLSGSQIGRSNQFTREIDDMIL